MSYRRFSDDIVYAVQGTMSKKIKIGRTTSCIKRYVTTSLINRSGEPVLILGFTPNLLEKDLHQYLESSRHHGEWFEPTKELLEVVEKYMTRPKSQDLDDVCPCRDCNTERILDMKIGSRKCICGKRKQRVDRMCRNCFFKYGGKFEEGAIMYELNLSVNTPPFSRWPVEFVSKSSTKIKLDK